MKEVIIISAPRNSGKTTKLWALYNELKKDNKNNICGYITKLESIKSLCTLINLENEKKYLLAKLDYEQHKTNSDMLWFKYGNRFIFSQQSFNIANEYYCNVKENCTHLFIDEAGPLERDGIGFSESLIHLQKQFNGTLIIAIRDIYVEKIISKFNITNYTILNT